MNQSKYYPIYILLFWVALWGIMFLFFILKMPDIPEYLRAGLINKGIYSGFIVFTIGLLTWKSKRSREKEEIEVSEMLQKAVEEKRMKEGHAMYRFRAYLKKHRTKDEIINEIEYGN